MPPGGTTTIPADEAERHRLARELHDGVAQALSRLLVSADLCLRLWDDRPEEARRELETVRRITSGALDEVRRILAGLGPADLADDGLGAAIARFVGQQPPGGPAIRVRVRGDVRRVGPGAASALFRIVQEGVQNALRHAGCRTIRVTLRVGACHAAVRVADDGRGFTPRPPGALAREGRYGLWSMAGRARAAGGRLTVRAWPSAGTRVVAVIPLDGQDA